MTFDFFLLKNLVSKVGFRKIISRGELRNIFEQIKLQNRKSLHLCFF